MKIVNQTIEPVTTEDRIVYEILDRQVALEDKVHLLKHLLSDAKMRTAFEFRCVQHPRNTDDFHIAEAFGYGGKK